MVAELSVIATAVPHGLLVCVQRSDGARFSTVLGDEFNTGAMRELAKQAADVLELRYIEVLRGVVMSVDEELA
jgi:hypothetical protein